MREAITRRRCLVLGATAATGIGVVSLAGQEASAKVAVESLDVPDDSYTLTDESVNDIRLSVDSAWKWSGNAKATAYELRLKAGSTVSNAEQIAREEKSDLGRESLTGETTLQGSLFNTSIFDSSHFTPSNGTIETNVVVVVEFDVIRDGEVAETAQATDSATITVSKEELEYTVELSATGSFEFEAA